MRILLISNPCAGHRSRRDISGAVADAFRAGGWEVTVRQTPGPNSAGTLARAGADEGYDAVFACGGDGTLSEVVTGLLDTGVPAGVIPAGTGNDFARTLGLPLDPVSAAERYLLGTAGVFDLLCVDGGSQWAINVMGVGFDAGVARRVNRRSRLTGGLAAYLMCVAAELASNRPLEVGIAIDGERWEGRALLVAIANARSYGAGMMIAPHARIDDGLLDVVLVEHMTRASFVRHFPRVMRGTHLSLPCVRTWRGTEVSIETDEPSPVLIDGDLKSETPLTVQIAAGRARLWMPGSAEAPEGSENAP